MSSSPTAASKEGEDQNGRRGTGLQAKIDLHNRMISPRALGHNKFLVICDVNANATLGVDRQPELDQDRACTQANNSVLIDDRLLAAEFRKQWDLLRRGQRDLLPLKTSNSKPRKTSQIGRVTVVVHADRRPGGSDGARTS